ncbi:MAG: FGGY family carbohydrate kinase [Sedimentisphaerales bacterium]|nr:FGGY family carbohydrate kinase [Sedimentisphaerales bacterium]
MALLLGYDVGSSSIKATIIDAGSGKVIASATSPEKEMPITAKRPGWAEQAPAMWWQHVVNATAKLRSECGSKTKDIKAIGISYQMHGLVAVDKNGDVLRPAIIWCDSRAVEIGNKAAQAIGTRRCLRNLLNLPGNFTASKLAWVKANEPGIYKKIYKVMLPGDYIAYVMTGQIYTTPSGLSEAILWDYTRQDLARFVLDHYGIDPGLIPDLIPTFGIQGELTSEAARQLGVPAGTPVAYRAGDQPNNAFSLGVLEPGQVAATAGTSGVVYGITDQQRFDPRSRVNTFVHVNHRPDRPRYGVLLCLNGAGILNSWVKHQVCTGLEYDQMDALAAQISPGCGGLVVLPYGNGAERTLDNRLVGGVIANLNFNIHTKAHIARAAQEGVIFALKYGLEIMQKHAGVKVNTVRAGHANMFLSPVFATAFATATGATVELYNTDGSQGAARAAGVGAGIYRNLKQAFAALTCTRRIRPEKKAFDAYQQAYNAWVNQLGLQLGSAQ